MTPRKTTKTTVRIAALLAFATATTTVAPAALATNAFGTTQPAATVAPAAVTAAPSPTASVDFDLGRYNQTRKWRGTATIAPQSGATITSVEMRRYDASGTLTAAGQGTAGVNQLPTDITAPTRIVYIVHTDKGVYAAPARSHSRTAPTLSAPAVSQPPVPPLSRGTARHSRSAHTPPSANRRSQP